MPMIKDVGRKLERARIPSAQQDHFGFGAETLVDV